MEELPDEVTLLVLAHIDPLRDTAAVSGTCRKWRRLMVDPHLWKGFHHRTFPAQLRIEDEQVGDKDDERGAAGRPWRHSYLEKARHLRRLLDKPPAGERGDHGRLLAAALVGCLPLAEREVARLVAAHGGDPAVLSTLAYSPWGYQTTPVSLVGECLQRACLAGSLPLAQLFVAQGPDGKEAGNIRPAEFLSAVQSGNLQLVSFIWDQAGTELKPHFDQIFECAAAQGNVNMLELLLRVAVPTRNSVIARAAGSGSLEAVQLLLDRGCYWPVPTEMWVSHDAINSAVISGNLAIVQLLQQHGATLKGHHMVTALSQAESPSREMLQHLVPALGPHVWRECLTSPALRRGDVAVCRFLVDHGVDINFAFGSGCDLGKGTALHHAVLYNYDKMAQCLLECGASASVKAKGMRMTALGLARQYGNKASQIVTTHRPGKRKRMSTSEADKKKNENEDKEKKNDEKEMKQHEDGVFGDDDDEKDGKTKPAKKKQKQKKQEPSPEKREEKELEAEVRRLAKLKDDAKLDVFTLRQMLRRRGVLAGDVPKRKLPLLQLAVDWLAAGN